MSGTPGPNNTLLFRSGARFGARASLPHMAGISVGFPLMFLAIAGGFGEVLRAYPIVFTIMRWVGIVYLLYLAWHIASEKPSIPDTAETTSARPMTFMQALLFQWVNPKAWIIASGTFFTYTQPSPRQWQEILVITVVFLLVNPCSCALWTWLGVQSAGLMRNARAALMLQYGMAALLVLSIIPILTERTA